MSSQPLQNFSGTIPVSLLGGDKNLVKSIQDALTGHGYLDPPADGLFGHVSLWALKEFCYRQGLSLGAGFTEAIAKSLLQPARHLPKLPASGHWLTDYINFGIGLKHWYSRHPQCWNILYIEGIEPSGKINSDAPNRFNDVRTIFRLNETGALELYVWEGTTEPGTYWTETVLMNPNGAARIKFGQYKSWRVGIHNSNHEGLRQVLDVSVHRDLNKDYKRTNDIVQTGVFYINQHWGYDAPKNDLGNSSAGCLVGRTKNGHREFMSLIKRDARYLASPTYTFMTSILPASKVLTI